MLPTALIRRRNESLKVRFTPESGHSNSDLRLVAERPLTTQSGHKPNGKIHIKKVTIYDKISRNWQITNEIPPAIPAERMVYI